MLNRKLSLAAGFVAGDENDGGDGLLGCEMGSCAVEVGGLQNGAVAGRKVTYFV